MYCISNAQLMLSFENQKLTFGFYAESNDFALVEEARIERCISEMDTIEILKRYLLPNKHHFYLTRQITDANSGLSEFSPTMKPEKSIHELLESIIDSPIIPPGVKIEVTNIQVAISLESKEILGYSAKHLIKKIAQTFKKVFPLFVIFNFYDYDDNNYFPEIIIA